MSAERDRQQAPVPVTPDESPRAPETVDPAMPIDAARPFEPGDPNAQPA